MQALITGVSGFVGRHLVRQLLEDGWRVGGLVHPSDGDHAAQLASNVELFHGDLLDDGAVVDAISRWRPETIYHLAAFSNPESSWGQSRRTLETNIIGTHNVLQAALESGLRPRILLVGSCQQYGLVPEDQQPISEERAQRPLSPYGVSKVSQEVLGQRFFLAEKIPVLLVRSFNHTGPGQDSSYVCSSFARQIAEIERGLREPRLRVGNLSARRDFIDVRDVVSAYRRVIDEGEPIVPYNVCRGEAPSIRALLDQLLALTPAEVEVEVDRDLYHAVDVPLLLGDNTRLRKNLGWEPRFSMKQTLADLLEDWRGRVDRE